MKAIDQQEREGKRGVNNKELHFYYDLSPYVDIPRISKYTKSIEILGIMLCGVETGGNHGKETEYRAHQLAGPVLTVH